MQDVLTKLCNEILDKLVDLERKAQHDVVYYQGAREAVILIASEFPKKLAEEIGRQQQPTTKGDGSEGSLPEVRSQRAKRQKADHPAK
jgi:hypothetical protein